MVQRSKFQNICGGVARLVGIDGGVVFGLSTPSFRRCHACGDHAMRSNITEPAALHSRAATKFGKQRRTPNFFTTGLTKFETGVCDRVRSFIEGMIETKLETAPSQPRYDRPAKARDETDNVVR